MTTPIRFFPNAPLLPHENYAQQMIQLGYSIRNDLLWKIPLLPGAVIISCALVSGREWKVTGAPRQAARAVEYFNDAVSISHDGIVEYGLEQMLSRMYLDQLCMGRDLFTWGEGEPLRYLDPYEVSFQLEQNDWLYGYTSERFPASNVAVFHSIPIGSYGGFISPIAPLIPTAMLAWLIREHDSAAADGRKIRDITLVIGEDLADQIKTAIDDTAKLWSGANPAELGIPVVWAETQANMKASDMIAKFGLAEIPPGFDRDGFQFQFVNEISANIGLAMRHFWNSERATNRALEDVQEARQQQKGPSAYIRSKQRSFNRTAMKMFGKSRFSFIEEVDTASRKVNAEVLKLIGEALAQFATVLNAEVNGEAFVAWMQQLDALPADLDLIANIGAIQPEADPSPVDGKKIIKSDAETVRSPKNTDKAIVEVNNDLDYGEVALNQHGEVIARRAKIFTIEKAIRDLVIEEYVPPPPVPTFASALIAGRKKSVEKYAAICEKFLDHPDVKLLQSKQGDYSDDDYRLMHRFVSEHSA